MDANQLAILDSQIEFFEAHPEQHNQEEYVTVTQCGTAFCVAGHLLIERGLAVVINGKAIPMSDTPDWFDWEVEASNILGIDFDFESDNIFREWLTLDNVKYGRDWLADRYGLPLKYNDEVDPEYDARYSAS